MAKILRFIQETSSVGQRCKALDPISSVGIECLTTGSGLNKNLAGARLTDRFVVNIYLW